jgi:hypothetical protein
MTHSTINSEAFIEAFANTNDFVRNKLTESMTQNVEFWGNKAADYAHKLSDQYEAAIERDASEERLQEIQLKINEAEAAVSNLRTLWKALQTPKA